MCVAVTSRDVWGERITRPGPWAAVMDMQRLFSLGGSGQLAGRMQDKDREMSSVPGTPKLVAKRVPCEDVQVEILV